MFDSYSFLPRAKSRFDPFTSFPLFYGYTLQEIAQYLGVHYATVSSALKQTEKAKRDKT
jgi:DNA-binding MarR family transcriptional regulator